MSGADRSAASAGQDPGAAASPRGQSPCARSPRSARPLSLDAAHERIGALEAQLSEQARVRAELVHLVSHELRTPITVISGFGRLLQNEVQGPLAPEQHRFVAEMLKSCARLDAFVADLLEARLDGSTPFRVESASARIHETIDAQLEALMPMLEERGLRVELSLRASDDATSFDARRIAQVVTNLMTNAIRYGRAGGVIRVETCDATGAANDAPDRIEVAIEDDGDGIPEADRERLFEPFVRGAGRADTSGLGIGLALCRRIIEAHGGCIHVTSGRLGGARFVFELPRVDPAEGKDGQDGD